MSWFILVCYILAMYGLVVIVTQGIGPFNILFRMREWAKSVGDNFGLLLSCPLCMGTNVGWMFSLINWFLIPTPISPFNMILHGTELWYVAAILDGCITGGLCHFLWNVDDYIDKNTPIFEDDIPSELS